MKKVNNIHIISGGTMVHVSPHFSLCAPAYGKTGIDLCDILVSIIRNGIFPKKNFPFNNTDIILTNTKMVDRKSNIETVEDVSKHIDQLIEDPNTSAIFMPAAICDFEPKILDIEFEPESRITNFGKNIERLKTLKGDIQILLTPTEKIIKKIRLKRPDIFLVGFKTTTNASKEEMFLAGLKFMKSTKCNLVLVNEIHNRMNMIITPEEAYYCYTKNRKQALTELCEIFMSRIPNTFSSSIFQQIEEPAYLIDQLPENFKSIIQELIDNKAFICNNGNDFTPGHFCYTDSDRIDKTKNFSYICSQRKADHNKVFEEGMSLVTPIQDNNSEEVNFQVKGKRKASVGARSQYYLLQENPEYNCIIHTHNPIKEGSQLPIVSQKEFQCGSIECGQNTLNGLKKFENGKIAGVYLDKHGANFMFHSDTDPNIILNFIKNNIVLGEKTR